MHEKSTADCGTVPVSYTHLDVYKRQIFTSEASGYVHLHRWDWKKKKLTDLTPGKYDIADITGVDKAKKLVYYTCLLYTSRCV